MVGLLWADFICSLFLCVCRAEFPTLLYVSRSSWGHPGVWDHRSYALPASLESNHKLIAVITELQKRVLGIYGGARVDEFGDVIRVVVAKLSQRAALATTGTIVENVNYAIKSSYLLSFLESVPEVAAKLNEPRTNNRKFEDVIKDVEQSTVLVPVY